MKQGGTAMPTSRLYIDLPDNELDFLKQYAAKNKTTIASLFNRWLKSLKSASKPVGEAIHPDIKRFTGIIPKDVDLDKTLTEYITEKHK